MATLVALLLFACRPPGPPPDYVRYEVAPMTTEEQRASVTGALDELRAAQLSLSDARHRDPMCMHKHLDAVTALVEASAAAQQRFERAVAVLDTTGAASEVHDVARALSEARTVVADAKGCGWLDPAPQPSIDGSGKL